MEILNDSSFTLPSNPTQRKKKKAAHHSVNAEIITEHVKFH